MQQITFQYKPSWSKKKQLVVRTAHFQVKIAYLSKRQSGFWSGGGLGPLSLTPGYALVQNDVLQSQMKTSKHV